MLTRATTTGMAAAAVICAAATGCADVDYRAATTHDEVVEITEKQVLSGQRVHLEQKGRLLHVVAKRLCDTVEDKEMERISVQKSDENVTLEVVLMSLATVPIVTGAVLLADAEHVHDNDVNARTYNATGQDGARAAGIATMVLGTGMLVGGMVSLIHRAKPKTDSSTFHEDGELLLADKPCRGTLRQGALQVRGILDTGAHVSLGTTNPQGELTVDLARVVPANHFAGMNAPLSLQVQIGNDGYGLVDLEAVAAHHREREEAAWSRAGAARCDHLRTQPACAMVQQFASTFPHSVHAAEAQALVANIGQPNPKVTQIAGDTCAQKCLLKCENNQACAADCARQVCR